MGNIFVVTCIIFYGLMKFVAMNSMDFNIKMMNLFHPTSVVDGILSGNKKICADSISKLSKYSTEAQEDVLAEFVDLLHNTPFDILEGRDLYFPEWSLANTVLAGDYSEECFFQAIDYLKISNVALVPVIATQNNFQYFSSKFYISTVSRIFYEFQKESRTYINLLLPFLFSQDDEIRRRANQLFEKIKDAGLDVLIASLARAKDTSDITKRPEFMLIRKIIVNSGNALKRNIAKVIFHPRIPKAESLKLIKDMAAARSIDEIPYGVVPIEFLDKKQLNPEAFQFNGEINEIQRQCAAVIQVGMVKYYRKYFKMFQSLQDVLPFLDPEKNNFITTACSLTNLNSIKAMLVMQHYSVREELLRNCITNLKSYATQFKNMTKKEFTSLSELVGLDRSKQLMVCGEFNIKYSKDLKRFYYDDILFKTGSAFLYHNAIVYDAIPDNISTEELKL